MANNTAGKPLLTSFSLPADQNDFPGQPNKLEEMRKRWNDNMNTFTNQAIVGDPWTVDHDHDRLWYYNPLDTELTSGQGLTPPQAIFWTAFPNRLNIYFGSDERSPYGLTQTQIYELADYGKLDVPGFEKEFAKIPSVKCPIINWNEPKTEWKNYDPLGPRGWLDEYCEWSVTRNAENKITKVIYTCENPEYWYNLWLVDPDTVLRIYQQCISSAVELEDLYLKDPTADGKWAIDSQTGLPAYNPLNKWNYGTHSLPDKGGAMHLTSPPNTIGAEIYLAAAATFLRQLPATQYAPQNLICCSEYGRPYRNSDPHIGFQVNQLVKNFNAKISLTNPIGLYIQTPDFSNYQTRDGTDPATFWKIVRGRSAAEAGVKYDQILHAVFEVPPEAGYTVSDITIGGTVVGSTSIKPEPIMYAGQIASTFHVCLAGTGITPVQPAQSLLLCPTNKPTDEQNGWPALLIANNVLEALNAFNSNEPLSLVPQRVQAGQGLKTMALMTAGGGLETATIAFWKNTTATEPPVLESGIKVDVVRTYFAGGTVPGQSAAAATLVYVINIHVGAGVKPGPKGVTITNPKNTPGPPCPGFLIVV